MSADRASPRAQTRAGGTVLSLLAAPLSAPILRAHLEGPLRLPDLRDRLGGAAQTTLRCQVRNLRGIGALERRVRSGMPYTVENELTDAGRGILAVAEVAEAWLSRAPHGPLALGSEPAKGAIRALVAGWESTIVRALAASPLSLTALDGAIAEVSYPSLERRLSAMRAARQVETVPGGPGGTKPYLLTEWARRAVIPLVAAGRCEREHLANATGPLTRGDIEAVLMLAAPLAGLPPSAGGTCCLAVGDADGGREGSGAPPAGVCVEIERGATVSCAPGLGAGQAAWVAGHVESWGAAILDGRFESLRFGGEDAELAHVLVERVRRLLG